jgi:hypothetical protein
MKNMATRSNTTHLIFHWAKTNRAVIFAFKAVYNHFDARGSDWWKRLALSIWTQTADDVSF